MREFFLEQMARYSAYHRNARNRATHAVGIPAIVFSLLLALSPIELIQWGSVPVTTAVLAAIAVMLYWILLGRWMGVATAAIYVPVLFLAHAAAAPASRWWIFAVAFSGGWVLQLVGHVFEGRRPALVDNLTQIFIAPMFIVVEGLVSVGLCKNVHAEIERRWAHYASSAR